VTCPTNAPERSFDQHLIRAKVKLGGAIDLLARTMPFHAETMSAWTAKPDTCIGTCGIFWEQGCIQMRYDPSWLDSLTVPAICGALVHQCLHLLFGHVYIDPQEETDGRAMFVATEVTVNEFVKTFPLPGEPLLLEHYPELAPLQSTRLRYDLLQRHPVDTSGSSGAGDSPNPTESPDTQPTSVDSHTGWESIRKGGTAARLAIAVAKDQALHKYGHLLDEATRKALGAGPAAGTRSGESVEQVRSAAGAWLDWRTILSHLPPPRQYPEPTLSRPPRRQPEMAGIVPGRRHVPQPPILLVAIDVSSSMSCAILGWIKQEVRALAALYRVALVEVDMKVTRSLLLFDGSNHNPNLVDNVAHGRGGTSFDAAFAPEVLAWAAGHEEVDALLYFTDGFAPPPAKRATVPTIWILADEHGRTRIPARWGTVVNTQGKIIRAN
jgi:predicted metal-dependent peptidase